MPSVTLSLQPDGPIITVGVAVSVPRIAALNAAGIQPPNPVIIRALLDTGASCTCIDPAVIARLGLSPTGSTQMLTPSTGSMPHQCNQYDVALGVFLDGNEIHYLPTIPVIDAVLNSLGFDALIGRDVIGKSLLFYNGPAKLLTVSF